MAGKARSLHGSLACLMACDERLSPASLQDAPKETEVTEVVLFLLQAAGTICSPPPGGCRMQGQGAGDELSLPCVGTKAALGPGTQLRTSCRLRAWPACLASGRLWAGEGLL